MDLKNAWIELKIKKQSLDWSHWLMKWVAEYAGQRGPD